jgi:hypothetical protein
LGCAIDRRVVDAVGVSRTTLHGRWVLEEDALIEGDVVVVLWLFRRRRRYLYICSQGECLLVGRCTKGKEELNMWHLLKPYKQLYRAS